MRRDSRYRFQTNDSPNHLEVHDLDNEKVGCKINQINNQHSRYLSIQTLLELGYWFNQNPAYDGCEHCLPEYHRK